MFVPKTASETLAALSLMKRVTGLGNSDRGNDRGSDDFYSEDERRSSLVNDEDVSVLTDARRPTRSRALAEHSYVSKLFRGSCRQNFESMSRRLLST